MAQNRFISGAPVTYSTDQNISPGYLIIGLTAGTGTLTINGGNTHDQAGFIGMGNSGAVFVTGTGTWTSDADLAIGYTSDGMLTISSGGRVSDSSSDVGEDLGTSETITVTGTGSSWTTAGSLTIGEHGTGTLMVNAGGTVNGGTDTIIGASANGSGNITITGTNASLTTAQIDVGNGSLTVSNGGSVNAGTINVSYYSLGSSGVVNVNNGGSISGINTYIGKGGNGSAIITGAGSTWTNTGTLWVGFSSTGTFTIAGGSSVTDTDTDLGSMAGTSGTITVTDAGSHLTNTGTFTIGERGNGLLDIENGATVSGTDTYLGAQSGSTGTITVNGAGSHLTNMGTLTIGDSGNGMLDIENGAKVGGADIYLGTNSGSTGTITVNGAGSSLTNNNTLTIGAGGDGTLNVTGGATVTGTLFLIGDGGNGKASVSEAGSVWTAASGVMVGESTTGTFTVNDGGSVNGGDTVIGDKAGSSGTITVTGSNSSWTAITGMEIGEHGAGTIIVSNGGTVQVGEGYIGDSVDGSGNVIVTGSNSSLTSVGAVVVGFQGTGTLTICDGGRVTATEADYIGYITGSSGTVTVTGPGSSLINNSDFGVGEGSEGTVIVSNGGSVSGTNTYIGDTAGSQGNVTVTDSSWKNDGILAVGNYGTGSLTVSDGGIIHAAVFYLGYYTGSSGTMTVTGPGSSVISGGDLIVGGGDGTDPGGNGTLTVSNGGSVTTPGVILIGENGDTGTLNIGAAADSPAAAAPGILSDFAVILGANGGTGTIVFNHTGTGYIFSSNVSGNGTINVLSGTTILTGDNDYSGNTVVSGGTLVAGSATALGVGNITINAGTLTGNGTGPATIGGNYRQNGGDLLIHVTSPTASDQFVVSGSAQIGGNLVIDFSAFTNATKNISYTILTAQDGITGTFTDADALQTVALSPTLKAIATLDSASTPEAIIVDTALIQLPFATLPGAHLTPNQFSVASNIDTVSTTSTNPGLQKLVGGLNSVSNNASSFGLYLNQLMPLNFENFTSSTAFNNTSFWVQQFDNYLANHRGADGTFVSSAGGLDYSGLAINDPNIDTGLQSVRSRLLAWSPAPSTGLLSDSSSLVAGGVNMKDVAAQSGPTNLWNVFVTGNVVLAQDFSDANLPYSSSTTGAVQIGADYKITPHWLAGVTFGYGHTHADLDAMGSNANVNTYSPGVYTSYYNNGWYANGLANYGFTSYSQSRAVSIGAFNGTASSSPGGSQIVGNIDGGYDFHKGNWTFGPTLGLEYTHLDVDGYTETGLPGANLTVDESQSDSLRSVLGGRVSYAVKSGSMLFTPHLSASWQHEFMDQSRGITSQFSEVAAGSFVVNTANPSRESALVDVGFDGQINNALTVFTDYSVQAGQSNYFGQSIQAGVKIGF